jgi:serine/threonine-protein kinase RsbW
MIMKIYKKLNYVPEVQEPEKSNKDLLKRPTKLSVKPDQKFVTATIKVDQIGEHALNKVAENLKHLCIQRYETIYLKLPLYDPFTAILCEDFENLGFFFSGIHPGKPGNNFLMLQYLNNQVMDYDLLDIDSDFGKELTAYVKGCDPNTE